MHALLILILLASYGMACSLYANDAPFVTKRDLAKHYHNEQIEREMILNPVVTMVETLQQFRTSGSSNYDVQLNALDNTSSKIAGNQMLFLTAALRPRHEKFTPLTSELLDKIKFQRNNKQSWYTLNQAALTYITFHAKSLKSNPSDWGLYQHLRELTHAIRPEAIEISPTTPPPTTGFKPKQLWIAVKPNKFDDVLFSVTHGHVHYLLEKENKIHTISLASGKSTSISLAERLYLEYSSMLSFKEHHLITSWAQATLTIDRVTGKLTRGAQLPNYSQISTHLGEIAGNYWSPPPHFYGMREKNPNFSRTHLEQKLILYSPATRKITTHLAKNITGVRRLNDVLDYQNLVPLKNKQAALIIGEKTHSPPQELETIHVSTSLTPPAFKEVLTTQLNPFQVIPWDGNEQAILLSDIPDEFDTHVPHTVFLFDLVSQKTTALIKREHPFHPADAWNRPDLQQPKKPRWTLPPEYQMEAPGTKFRWLKLIPKNDHLILFATKQRLGHDQHPEPHLLIFKHGKLQATDILLDAATFSDISLSDIEFRDAKTHLVFSTCNGCWSIPWKFLLPTQSTDK